MITSVMPAETPWLHPALLQERTADGVRCLTCERRCTLSNGQTGWCRTRQNREGTLYTLTYGLLSSLSANPIEKKPLYHVYPGTVALTAGAYSCNFACPWCQNWHISVATPPAAGEYSSEKWCYTSQRNGLAITPRMETDDPRFTRARDPDGCGRPFG